MAFFGLFGGKKKSGVQTIYKPPYTGQRPFTADEVGYGAPQLKTLSESYLPRLIKRSEGEGVGFDPRRREILRDEFLKDFGDYSSDVYSKASQQASGQGLRGGIPMEIQADNTKSLARARESGLAGIDVEDLAARREDTNQAFYQLPQEVTRGTGIQKSRADFDLAEYNATLPDTLIDEPSYAGPQIGQALTDIGTSYATSGGNPYLTLAQVLMKQMNNNQGANKSYAQTLQPYGY